MNGNQLTPGEREALLLEYQVCEQDNAANFQGFWTLAAIFIGLSSALLAGLVYAVIANESLLNILLCNNDPPKTLVIGIIALIISIANVIIVEKLKGWHRRIMFNQGVINGRMRELELQLGVMQRGWRIYAVDRWYDSFGDKEPTDKSDVVWEKLKPVLEKNVDPRSVDRLDILKGDLVRLIQQYFPKQQGKGDHKYETWSSRKHFPWILYTLMSLWVLVIATVLFVGISVWNMLAGIIVATVIIITYVAVMIWHLKGSKV